MSAVTPINESIREIDENSWLITSNLLLSRQNEPSSKQPSWGDGKGQFFVLSEAPTPAGRSSPLPETSELRKVYDAGGVSAVWKAGHAFIKVKQVDLPDATREHITLDFLRGKGPLGFDIPRVYHHSESQDRYCIVLSEIPGPTLAQAWPGMDESERQHYVGLVTAICERLATWKGDGIRGVDGRQLSDLLLTKSKAEDDCDPQKILRSCEELGMDCSTFCFYHCDLGPGNIIVNERIGILDWETAGFVPREWIRTKFSISSGMDLPVADAVDWRRRVSRQLGARGFPEVADEWLRWWRK